ncbi:MAG: ABC transporter permease [Phycisphaerae bacterium]|nr:MAG: ABC transporter permease [Phycisphaerae bacterium]
MLGKPISQVWRVALGVVGVCIVLGGYTYLSDKTIKANEYDRSVPSWSMMKDGLQKAIEPGRRDERWLVVDTKASSRRLFIGMGISVAGSLLLGVLMGVLAPVDSFLYPIMAMASKMVPTAMIAVFFVLLGIGEKAFIGIVVFGILPTLTQSVALSVRGVHTELIYKAYTLGASHLEVIWNVVLRQIFPAFLDAVRLSVGPALVYLIAAEMLFADEGFGYRIRLEMKKLNMDIVFPYIAIMAMLFFVLDFALNRFNRWANPWNTPAEH